MENQNLKFQSTRPVRGATGAREFSNISTRDFNPRAPCGARQWAGPVPRPSILFQSTRPVRGATAGSVSTPAGCANFNPRAPCGARQKGFTHIDVREKFQSTRPVRGATKADAEAWTAHMISIHAPRAGRDQRVREQLHVRIGISIHAPRAGRDCPRRSWNR